MSPALGPLSRLLGGGRVKRTADWPMVEGVITLFTQSGDTSELSYTYNVKGRNYYGQTVNFLLRPEHYRPNVDIEDQALPIRVRYNPERPSNCSIIGKDNPILRFRLNITSKRALLIEARPSGRHPAI